MLKIFLNRSRGSITVMVTLMLIPTIFFTGFLTDLARIKLSGNQAVMAADNYGEAILTEYDYLLKELYGLFAITQGDEAEKAKDAIVELQKYMQTSFNPASNAITWDHLAGWTGFLSGDFEGCMPYKNAAIEMDYKLIDSSKLSSQEVFCTQVGDFMRFRIAQEFMDDSVQNVLLDALEQGQNAEKDSVVHDAKMDFDDAVSELMEAMKEYYDVLKKINHYPEYINHINSEYEKVKKEFSDIAGSDSYSRWREYTDNKEAIEDALNVKSEDRTEEEEKLIDIKDKYDADENARVDKLSNRFDSALIWYEISDEDDIIDFDSFDILADDLDKRAEKVQAKMMTAKEQRYKLEKSLEAGATDQVKNEITDTIKKFDEFVLNGEYNGQCYMDLAQKVSENKGVNSDYDNQMQQQIFQLARIANDYVSDPAVDEIGAYLDSLYENEYDDFQNNKKYNNLYKNLAAMFDDKGSKDEKEGKEKKDAANEAQKNAEKELNEKETTNARSIPDAIAIGNSGNSGGSTMANLLKSAASYFKMNSFAEAGNRLLLKFYMSAYDYGMFSNRITNVKKSSDSEKEKAEEAVSLTGIKMCKNVNYLYQAEMEYLYGGYKDSAENLNAARNSIVAFRSVVNMTSTYTIEAVNDSIKVIRDALMGLPVLAIAVEAALRLGITALETAADWKRLKEGEAVALIKKNVDDLEAFDAIKALVPELEKGSGKSDVIKLDYNQYMLVMITFLRTSDQIAARTGDLITLNVNAVKQEVGEDGELNELNFKLDDAYTAVEASCTVHINFVVMPDSFAKKAVDDAVYNSLTEYEKNKYKFTVARGY